MQTHINYLNKVKKILPIKKLVLEYAKFDIQKLENPNIQGAEYQQGRLHNRNLREYVKAVQNGKCLLCEKGPIEHLHHILPSSKEGSNVYKNIAGLCIKCHNKVHKDPDAKEALAKKITGIAKEYADTSILNTIMPRLYEELKQMLGAENIEICYGYETEAKRESLGLDKTHYNDSYTMALMAVKRTSAIKNIMPYQYRQYRRHNRAFCDAQRDRLYKKDGKIVARNRRRRTEHEDISLAEYRDKLINISNKEETAKEISKLKVYKATKRIKPFESEIPISKGSTVIYNGQRAIIKGISNKGKTLMLDGYEQQIPLRRCRQLTHNSGIVCL